VADAPNLPVINWPEHNAARSTLLCRMPVDGVRVLCSWSGNCSGFGAFSESKPISGSLVVIKADPRFEIEQSLRGP